MWPLLHGSVRVWYQARPGRQPVTASLAVGCWNVSSLGPQTEATPSSPRKTALIDLELDRLGIQLASLSETWWYSSGSIREEHYTIFWNGFENGQKPKQGVGIAVRNTLVLRGTAIICLPPSHVDQNAH